MQVAWPSSMAELLRKYFLFVQNILSSIHLFGEKIEK